MSDRTSAVHAGATTSPPENQTTDDIFLAGASGGGLHILQPSHGLRSGLDAVMLAAAAAVEPGQRVLDAGAGVGVVGLAVARRCPASHIVLLEREPGLAELAAANVARNGLQDRARVVCADLTQPLATLEETGLAPDTFDHVLANPPYHIEGCVRRSPHGLKSRASAFAAGDLDRWLRFLAAMVRPDGCVTLIHRADALAGLLAAIGGRFGAVRIFPLFPREGEAATRVLVQGTKGSRAPLEVLPGLILHGLSGAVLPEADAILRDGRPLTWRQGDR